MEAEQVYSMASHKAAMALSLLGKYGAAFYSTAVTPQPIEAVDGIPNWATLFGPPVACECKHCRSVFSPAAYLIDTLKFLDDNAGPALTRLLARRPDIGNIELSCENTDTEVPYVDLVNEVLENAVAPTAFSLEMAFQSGLDAGSISESLRQTFEANGALLSDKAAVALEATGSRWAIADPGCRYHIVKEGNQLEVTATAQTYGKSQELSADPKFINRKAYDSLAREVFPWNLPFDLWTEESRSYLAHLGTPRHRLMEIFHKGESLSELTDVDIASEHIGLTTF